VSDKPDEEVPDPGEPAEDQALPSEEPEQIWPPEEEPGDSASNAAREPSDAGRPPDVERIDEAIDELRQINGELSGEEEADSLSSSSDAKEIGRGIDETIEELERIDDAIDVEADKASPTVGPADEMVAAVIETPREPVDTAASQASEVKCHVREQSEDELGQLWGNVFFSAEHPPPKAIIVTSARPRDGATQIATALAMIGAEASRERRIALVDFNLRDPGIANVLDIPVEPGLTDVLDARCSLEAAMQDVTLKNGNQLHVLPSGPPVDKPLGLLKSRQVQSLIGQLQDRYDHTIIDMAAANAHPDSQVVGALVDGALLVARAGETPRETVAAAKKRLDLAGVRWLGLVLNQRSDPIPGFLYRMT